VTTQSLQSTDAPCLSVLWTRTETRAGWLLTSIDY